jgi:hypothetical protein
LDAAAAAADKHAAADLKQQHKQKGENLELATPDQAAAGVRDNSSSSTAVRSLDFSGPLERPATGVKGSAKPPVSPREADAAAATWAELQYRIKAGDRRTAAAAAGGIAAAAGGTAAAAVNDSAGSTVNLGSDGWEEMEAVEEGHDE